METKFERAWFKNKGTGVLEDWQPITRDRVKRELALTQGDDADKKLEKEGQLDSNYARYRVAQ